MTRRSALRLELTSSAIALLVAMAVGSCLILAFGESPWNVYRLLVVNTWGNSYGIGQVLFRATPLLFTGLAIALAFHAGLFNIGAEGQMIAGSFAAAIVGASIPSGTSFVVAIPAALLAAMIAGGLIGALPGWLRARFGAHEVINTIMANFIVAAVVLWIGKRSFFAKGTTHTETIVDGAQLPSLGAGQSQANWAFFIALACAAVVAFLLWRTRRGYQLRAVGFSEEAAKTAGISAGRVWITTMAASGALAGLVAANSVLGSRLHYYEVGMGKGVGFMGIAVALLGRNNPLGIVFAALFFGTLEQGGFAVSSLVPREVVEILSAVVILAVVATSAEVRRLAKLSVGVIQVSSADRSIDESASTDKDGPDVDDVDDVDNLDDHLGEEQ